MNGLIRFTKSHVFNAKLVPPHLAECIIEGLIGLSQPLCTARLNLQLACMVVNDERKVSHGLPLHLLHHLFEAVVGKLGVRWRALDSSSSHLEENGGGGDGFGWGGVKWSELDTAWPARSLEVAQVEYWVLGELALGHHLGLGLGPELEEPG